jgi:NADH:ubiquinone oxidoreductase subunit 6 (subunit J)
VTGGVVSGGVLLTGGAGWAFVVFAVLALAMAVAVVVAKNPVHAALFLLSSFLLVACIFILEQAEFVGAVQILVYGGGIMVLFLFVIMLVNQRTVMGGKCSTPVGHAPLPARLPGVVPLHPRHRSSLTSSRTPTPSG